MISKMTMISYFRYQTALHRAVLVDSQEMVELLISRGAEINKGDRDGVTPLALAVRYQNTSFSHSFINSQKSMIYWEKNPFLSRIISIIITEYLGCHGSWPLLR